jgi:RNA polymerase sigma-70 factor (ECF subfamily)
MNETDIGGAGRAFQPTLWTCVLKAKDPVSPERREALERLIRAYWKPAYAWLRRRGHAVEAAKDLTQGFFAAFLERDFLKYVDRGRGKFRTFLLTALQHYVADEFDRVKAKKRGGGAKAIPLDFAEAAADVSTEPPDQAFRREWAMLVLERSMKALRAEFESSGRAAEFDLLKSYLGAADPPSYAEAAKRLAITESDLKSRIHRLRKRYRESILGEVRAYTENEQEAQEELRDLFEAFS